MLRVSAVAAIAVLGLAGCVSAPDGATDSAVGGANRPVGLENASCDLLDPTRLESILGQSFSEAINTAESNETVAECQYTAGSQTALVMTKASSGNGRFLFNEAADAASRSLGEVRTISVKGAAKAYSLPNLGRVGMVVGDSYIEVSTLVPSASQQDVLRVARLAATSAQ